MRHRPLGSQPGPQLLERAALLSKGSSPISPPLTLQVQQVQDAQAGLDEDRETERVLEKTLKLKVAQWQKDKKNLRALLASLHEIAPPCAWKPVGMGELIDPKKVKRHYHKACLAVPPAGSKWPPLAVPRLLFSCV